ncbi:MAG TPA: hypothetical protein VK730_00665 [Solirubrobacteraceae bacterium]|nr:hypothetical protein [Solirubrobacteraceae bacterium]
MIAAALTASFACVVSTVPAASAAECSNEARRVEQNSTFLPECRAYELVTPTGNSFAEPHVVPGGLNEGELSSPQGMEASVSGDRMAWTSEYPSAKSTGLDYLSTRGVNGWTAENLIPPQSVENGLGCPSRVGMTAYSAELSVGVLEDGYAQYGSFKNESFNCGHDEPLLVSGEPLGFQNIFLRNNEHVSYKLVDVTPPNAPDPKPAPENHNQYFPAAFQAGSSDLSHVVFEEELPLAEGAGSGDELYEYFEGAVHLITYLPGGTPTPVHGVLAGSTPNTQGIQATNEFVPHSLADYRHAMSADGSRVFFEAEGGLYARTNAEQPAVEECATASKACSVQLDEAQGAAAGPSGGGKFMVASEDGSRVFFTDGNPLTADSHAESGKPDLYEYDFERSVGNRLVDLTAGSGDPGEVLGVSGAAANGEDIYFVAEAALTGSQQNPNGTVPQTGRPNLYVAREGSISFITSLDPSFDDCDWVSAACLNPEGPFGPANGGLTARTSGNGRFVAFESDLSLTGYDNEGPDCVPITNGSQVVEGYTPGRCEEIYLYSASENKLECVSCDPGGVRPVHPAIIHYPAPASDAEISNVYPQRYVSESGQVFFESSDPLVPVATNGKLNVYEYENGKTSLISSGTAEGDSYFLDASPDGSNVFFATAQSLLRADTSSVYVIYDARVGGGFVSQDEAIQPPACKAIEACRLPLSEAPAEFSAGSAALVGSGNLAVTPKQPVGPGQRQVKKPIEKPTRKQRLARALNACAKRYRHRPNARHSCEHQVRKHYGANRKRASK